MFPFIIFCVLVLQIGCSDKESEGGGFDKAIAEIQSSNIEVVTAWTGAVAAKADQQVREAGTLDYNRLASDAGGSAPPVSEALCASIKQKKAKLDRDSVDASRQLDAFLDREMVASLGRHPKALYAMKVVWPKSWLLDPGQQPEYHDPIAKADTTFLKSVLIERFVSPDGAFIAPSANSDDYPTLISWLRQSDNFLAGTVGTLTRAVRTAISECSAQAFKKD